MSIKKISVNGEEIKNDNEKAKEAGVSYGKYKAGLDVDYKESEYQVHSSNYMSKSLAKEPEQKATAMIK